MRSTSPITQYLRRDAHDGVQINLTARPHCWVR
jgi:hypothetical protein